MNANLTLKRGGCYVFSGIRNSGAGKGHGRKGEDEDAGSFELYVSDVSMGNQMIIANCFDHARAYMTLKNYDYIKTVNPNFIKSQQDWFKLVQKRSSLLNTVSIKHRNPWFDRLRRKIDKIEE